MMKLIPVLLIALLFLCPAAASAVPVTHEGPVTMRGERALESEAVVVVPSGEEVTVLEKDDSWCRVSWQGHEGYIRTGYLGGADPEDVETRSIDRNPGGFSTGQTVQNTSGLAVHVREEESLMSPEVVIIPPGDDVKLLAVGPAWCQVEYQEKQGHVRSRYLGRTITGGTPPPPTGETGKPGPGAARCLVTVINVTKWWAGRPNIIRWKQTSQLKSVTKTPQVLKFDWSPNPWKPFPNTISGVIWYFWSKDGGTTFEGTSWDYLGNTTRLKIANKKPPIAEWVGVAISTLHQGKFDNGQERTNVYFQSFPQGAPPRQGTLQIHPQNLGVFAGGVAEQLRAYSGGQDVTSQCRWTSADPAIATVDAEGRVTATGKKGRVYIYAEMAGAK